MVDVIGGHGIVRRESVDASGVADPIAHAGGYGQKPVFLLIAKHLHDVVHFADVVAVFVWATRGKNKAGYTAQDAPSTRLKITRDGRTYGRTDGHNFL